MGSRMAHYRRQGRREEGKHLNRLFRGFYTLIHLIATDAPLDWNIRPVALNVLMRLNG
jgi:hypothetical protein